MKKKGDAGFYKWVFMLLSGPGSGDDTMLEIEEGPFMSLYECLHEHVWRRDGRGRIEPYLDMNQDQIWQAQWANAGGVAP
jgi:hypothetical protein